MKEPLKVHLRDSVDPLVVGVPVITNCSKTIERPVLLYVREEQDPTAEQRSFVECSVCRSMQIPDGRYMRYGVIDIRVLEERGIQLAEKDVA